MAETRASEAVRLTRGRRLRGGGGRARIGHPGHGAATRTPGRGRVQAPAAAAVFARCHPRATAAAAVSLVVARPGAAVLRRPPPGGPAAGTFALTFPLPEAAAAGVFADAPRGGVAGQVAAVFTHRLPGTAEAAAAIHTRALPRATEAAAAAAAVVTAPLARVAGSGAPNLPDFVPSPAEAEATVVSDGSRVTSRVASDFTEARVAAEASPQSLPRVTGTVAAVSPDSLLRDAAAVVQVFADPSRVIAGEADVFTSSSRRYPAAAVALLADSLSVFAKTRALALAHSFPGRITATAVPAIYPPHALAGAAAAVFGCYSARLAVAAAAVGEHPLHRVAFQRPDHQLPGWSRGPGEPAPWKRVNFRRGALISGSSLLCVTSDFLALFFFFFFFKYSIFFEASPLDMVVWNGFR